MPEIEYVLAPWVEATFGVWSGAETPPDLDKRLPVVRVERLGGVEERFSSYPRVAVDVFASTAHEARTLANQICESLLFLSGPVGDAVIRSVRCDAGPARQPWANEAVHRRGMTLTVSLR